MKVMHLGKFGSSGLRSNPIISVIMLTHNREGFVSRAIDSILAQTFTNFEFIIVNNGSTDQSGEICDQYSRQDSRISVIHSQNNSIGSGRNSGLAAATGKYIAFVDDDDFAEPDFLEFLLTIAMDYDADVAICGTLKWENGNSSSVELPDKPLVMDAEDAVIELLWRKRYNNGFPAKLFARSLFSDLSFPEKSIYDDIHVMYKMLSVADKVVSYGLPKYNATRHSDNNSLATTKHDMMTAAFLEEYRIAYRERTFWLCKKFPSNTDYWWYFDWSFQISMIQKIIKYDLLDCEMHLIEMKQELKIHQSEFLNSSWILDFEKEWMKEYVLEKY